METTTGTTQRATATDCGTPQTRASEHLELARAALSRNIGNPTEQDWREHVARATARVEALR